MKKKITYYIPNFEIETAIKKWLEYDPLTGNIFNKRQNRLITSTNACGYILIRLSFINENGEVCEYSGLAHRIAWYLYYEKWIEKPFVIDHINRIRNDNRIINLRKVTYTENMQNKSNNISDEIKQSIKSLYENGENITHLASQFGVSRKSIQSWSKKYGWQKILYLRLPSIYYIGEIPND